MEQKRVKTKNCVIWTRVSTKYQEDNGGSLDYQRTLCESYAKANGFTVIAYYGGAHESAKTPGPLVKAMISAVKRNKTINYILVSEYDRFSRNAGQALNILSDLDNYGITVIATKTGSDTSTKEGFLMAGITLNLAQWDNRTRVDKFVSGKEDCIKKGIWVLAAPRGYDKTGKSKNTSYTLNDEGRLIRQAFQMKLKGYSNGYIVDRLSKHGMPISLTGLVRILTNPFYAGKIRHKCLGGQLVDCVNHERAVSYQDFKKVQKMIEDKTHPAAYKKENDEYPLCKYVKCAKDGHHMTAYKKKGKYGYYKCNSRGCNTNISANILHEKYEALLNNYDLKDWQIDLLRQIISDSIGAFNSDLAVSCSQLRNEITRLDNKIKAVKLRHATGEIEEDIYDEAITTFNSQRDVAAMELEKYQNQLSNSMEPIDSVVLTCSHLKTLWKESNLELKKRVQNLVFPEGIIWDREIGDYRTPCKNRFFAVMDRLSAGCGVRKKETSLDISSMCGRRDSNSHRKTPTTPSK